MKASVKLYSKRPFFCLNTIHHTHFEQIIKECKDTLGVVDNILLRVSIVYSTFMHHYNKKIHASKLQYKLPSIEVGLSFQLKVGCGFK